MQLQGILTRRYIILGGATLVVLWFWLASDRGYNLPTEIVWPINGHKSSSENDVFDFPLVDLQSLRDICLSTKWNSSLVFTCDNNHGGIGHVRNSILNCVRYAIGAGGSLVLPNIALRDMDGMQSESHIERRHGPGRKGIEYMFDKNHFVDSLRLSCPELLLIRHMEQTTSNRRRGLLPESLFENIPTSGLEHPDEWPKRLQAWIDKYMDLVPAAEPVIVDLEQSFLHYPTHSDGHALAHSFGDILKFRPDIRRLATTTLKELASWFELSFNVSEPIIDPSFMGVHLGTENPFLEQRHEVDVTYSHYQAQASAYIEQASFSKIPIMYVASGNLPEVRKLALEATKSNIAVTYKEDLLQDKNKAELDRLKWDQRALVDYLVLLKAQEFAGVGHSSFSWNVMLRRREVGDGEKAVLEADVYQDGQSTLYGVRSSYVESSGCVAVMYLA